MPCHVWPIFEGCSWRGWQHYIAAVLIRIGRCWDTILTNIATTIHTPVHFDGASPLTWIKRSSNVQADYLCHYTLSIRSSWVHADVEPDDFKMTQGSCLVGWSDGGYDKYAGGTAAFILALVSSKTRKVLKSGGIFDPETRGNDSLRMEAVGMEQLILAFLEYLSNR